MSSMSGKHTPGPFHVPAQTKLRIVASNGRTVATFGCDDEERDNWQGNAEFFTRAANAHEAMREALRAVMARSTHLDAFTTKAVQDALRLAEES